MRMSDWSSDVCASDLFRIVQEAFTNIRKYAQARHVVVSLRQTPTAIELTIEDDGVGFDPGSPKLARQGLAGLKHRVFTHGGQLGSAYCREKVGQAVYIPGVAGPLKKKTKQHKH